MHFPSCASEVHIEGTVSVLSIDDDNYKFPEGRELVSAVYNVSANKPFPRPVTVQIQHCISLHDEDEASHLEMSFVIADTEQGPPYTFRELCGGKFRCGSSYGEIQLTHFSTLTETIKWHLGYPITFSGRVYYLKDNTADVVVTKNLAAHITVSTYQCSTLFHEYNQYMYYPPIQTVSREYSHAVEKTLLLIKCNRRSSAIQLVVPMDPTWKITPFVDPAEVCRGRATLYT